MNSTSASARTSNLSTQQTRLLNEAISAYDASLQAVPRHLAALGGRAAAKTQLAVMSQQPEQSEQFADAFADYDEGVRRLPNDSTVYSDRAIAYAIKSLTLSKEADKLSNQGQAESEKAQSLNEEAEQDLLQALDDINKAIELNPNESQLYSWRSVLHYSAKKWEKALNDAEKAIKLDSSNVQGYLNQGWASFELGNKYDKMATEVRDDALSRKWGRQSARYYERAISSLRKGQDQENQESFVDLELAIGYIYSQLDKYEKAVASWSRVLEVKPDNWWALTLRGAGYSYLATGSDNFCGNNEVSLLEQEATAEKLNLAIKDFTDAIAIRADDAFSYHSRARYHYLLRNCPSHNAEQELAAAIENYTLAIEYDQQNNQYWQLRARMQIALGHRLFNANQETQVLTLLEEAKTDMTQAYALQPNDKNKVWLDFMTLGGEGWYSLPTSKRVRLSICNLKFRCPQIADCGLRIADWSNLPEFRLLFRAFA